ncbi:MAG: hypothetical protein ACT4TC_18850 [Myxococcaceae bacterium]
MCLTACVFGCTNNSPPNVNYSPDGGTIASSACTAYAQANCDKLEECNPASFMSTYGDLTACEDRQEAACNSALFAPRTSATPTRTYDCAGVIENLSCDDYLQDRHSLPGSGSACATLPGAMPTGASCSSDAQCQSASCWFTNSTDVCGTCEDSMELGQRCGADRRCGKGMVCGDGECVTPAGERALCDDRHPCGTRLTCVESNGNRRRRGEKHNHRGTTGTCLPMVVVAGETCDPEGVRGAECDLNTGLFCERTRRACMNITYVKPGQRCSRDNGLYCQGHCVLDRNSRTGICVGDAIEGQACDTVKGPFCVESVQCVSVSSGSTYGTCQRPATCG